MNSAFDAEFLADAAPDILELFGESVSYRPATGSARTISAHFYPNGSRQEDRSHHKLMIYSAQVYVKDHATDGINAPALGDSILDGTNRVWDYQNEVERAGGMRLLEYEHAAIIETGTPTQADV